MRIVCTFFGLIIGAALDGLAAALCGAVIGFMIALVIEHELRKTAAGAPAASALKDTQRRIDTLEARMAEMETRLAQLDPQVMTMRANATDEQVDAIHNRLAVPPLADASPAAQLTGARGAELTPPASIAAAARPTGGLSVDSSAREAMTPASLAADQPIAPRAPNPIWRFLTSGNAPVRIGLVVLFFGLAFLLKYVAERITVPIELRFVGVAAGGIAMLLLGWKLRTTREAYGLALEGGAVGVLYLTVFFAFRLYALLPAGLAFALLLGIAFFSALLAMRQDALSLALTGIIGGFLAPLLASTGEGNHVVLFSYYAVLNVSILYVAWHKAWRMLNLCGFAFTVSIGSAWGMTRWNLTLLSSTEPFLIFFLLLFVAIAVLYALRQSIELRHYVDSTLVFGTPIVAFGMQSRMVRHIEFGTALSALALAALYLILARWLHAKKTESLRVLVESFLALSVGFATLAIPLALDARWTSAAWALEGAVVYWAGRSQGRKFARAFGLLLQPLAAAAFLRGWVAQPDAIAVLNSGCLGCIIMALSGWFISYWMAKPAVGATAAKSETTVLMFVWASFWWLGGALIEIDRLRFGDFVRDVERVFVAASLVAMSLIGTKLDWHAARLSTLFAPVLIAIQAFVVVMTASHPFTSLAAVTWPIAFTVAYWLLRRHEHEAVESIVPVLHVSLAWIALALGTWELNWQLGRAGSGAWRYIGWAMLPAIALHIVATERFARAWPVTRWETSYRVAACAPVVGLLWMWGLGMGLLSDGAAHPIPYIPVMNPVDLAIAAIVLGLLRWTFMLRARAWLAHLKLTMHSAYALLGVLVFVWFNGTLLRTIHHYAGVPHRYDALMSSLLVQAALSLFWSILGVALMTIAARLSKRSLWFVGVALMGAVVLKLFVVDLSGVGTVERIVSFIGVGVLLMLVGYIAPMPPAESRRVEATDT